jgi:arsenate reductase
MAISGNVTALRCCPLHAGQKRSGRAFGNKYCVLSISQTCYTYNSIVEYDMKTFLGWTLLAAALLAQPKTASAQSRSAEGRSVKRSQIVFVCEHGAALSVVSAAYFNKLAREQHLNVRAIARGTTPQKDIAVSARAGLKADGVTSETNRPKALSPKDASQALRIVAFLPLPAEYSKIAPIQTWDDVPPTGANYAAARDAILKHLNELLRELTQNAQGRCLR